MNRLNDNAPNKSRQRVTIRQEDRDLADRIMAEVAAEHEDCIDKPRRAGWAHMQSSRGWR